jgi:hypothetical protein
MNNPRENEPMGSFYIGRMKPAAPKPPKGLPRGLLAVVSLIAFAAVIWYAYPQGQEKYNTSDIPLVRADSEQYKFKPEDPGGMVVPHQDSTVFDQVDKSAAARVEKLMPQTEEPMEKSLALSRAKSMNLTPADETNTAAASTEKKLEDMKKQAELLEKKIAPVETPKTEAAPVKAVMSKSYIQLGAFRDVAAAKQEWARLQKKYNDLSGLKMRTEKADLGAKGVYYRLQAGVSSEAKAKNICAAMKANKNGCIVVKK